MDDRKSYISSVPRTARATVFQYNSNHSSRIGSNTASSFKGDRSALRGGTATAPQTATATAPAVRL